MKRFIGKPVFVHDFTTHKSLEWQCGEHVEPEEEASDVHHQVVVGEVVEHVAQRLIAKGEIAGECHDKTCNTRYTGTVVCDAREAIDGRLAKGAVDEETVVVTNESKGYNSYRFEYASMDDEGAT